MNEQTKDEVRATVREQYGSIARATSHAANCCGAGAVSSLKLGYSDEDLAAVPDGANMGLGCGNPRAIAALQAGETVLDLGAGGGFDCFLAAKQVGPSGRVIGVDMTPAGCDALAQMPARCGIRAVPHLAAALDCLQVVDMWVA